MVALTKPAVLIQRGNPVGFNERANQIFPMRSLREAAISRMVHDDRVAMRRDASLALSIVPASSIIPR